MNALRILITVTAMAAFLTIVWWAYAPSRKRRWESKGDLQDIDP